MEGRGGRKKFVPLDPISVQLMATISNVEKNFNGSLTVVSRIKGNKRSKTKMNAIMRHMGIVILKKSLTCFTLLS